MGHIDIEFICTGNQCRSVMAEAFARRIATERGLDVVVDSSGLLPAGSPPPDEVIGLMADRGIDVSAHRSRPFDADIVANADLIIGMERRHITEIASLDPEAYRRTFTLPEFVRRVDALDLVGGASTDPGEVVAMIGETRGRRDVLRISRADEIADPMGAPPKVFESTATRIGELVGHLMATLWPAPVAV